LDLTGRHVLVTGGSRGIGRGLAEAFAQRGAKVTILARTEGPLREAAEQIGAEWIAADVADPGQLEKIGERAGNVDVLVNNAGYDAVGRFTELSADELRQLWDINVVAPADLARQVLPGMIERSSGRIVFISSLSAEVALPGLGAYSAAKAAVSQLAEGVRADVRGTGVGVTLVELGAVATEMYAGVRDNEATAKAFDRVHRLQMLRELKVDEVVRAVVRAVERDRDAVVRPRRGRLQYSMARMPQRVARFMRFAD
jgi:short-subunit dehydrogenase